MGLLAIQNQNVRVEIDPAFGARVLSLVDLRSGRDWMAKGPQSRNVGEDAVYMADEAVGWDECFPTVAPWDATGTALGRRLRDHGDLWGRPWTVDVQSAHSATLSCSTGGFRFTRRLSLDDATLTADYTLRNIGHVTLPYMWALHGLLAVAPGDRIKMPGIESVVASYLSRDGRTIVAPRLSWPRSSGALDMPLDEVKPASSRFAAKLYASQIPDARVSVGGANGWIDIAWDNRQIGHLGLWFNYGGWPAPGEVHHLALEPTTAPVDHLGQALDQGTAHTLRPGASAQWRVTMTFRPHGSH